MKIRPVGAEFFHADERTDLPMLIVAFRNFANAPKNATHFAFTPVLYYIKTYKCEMLKKIHMPYRPRPVGHYTLRKVQNFNNLPV